MFWKKRTLPAEPKVPKRAILRLKDGERLDFEYHDLEVNAALAIFKNTDTWVMHQVTLDCICWTRITFLTPNVK